MGGLRGALDEVCVLQSLMAESAAERTISTEMERDGKNTIVVYRLLTYFPLIPPFRHSISSIPAGNFYYKTESQFRSVRPCPKPESITEKRPPFYYCVFALFLAVFALNTVTDRYRTRSAREESAFLLRYRGNEWMWARPRWSLHLLNGID